MQAQHVKTEENRKPRSQWKDRYVYTMLGLFGGLLGLHNFYLGRWKIALAQVLLSLGWILALSCAWMRAAWLFFGIVLIWMLLDVFCVKHEPDGDLMNDEAASLRLLLIIVYLFVFIFLPLLFMIYIKI